MVLSLQSAIKETAWSPDNTFSKISAILH